MAKVADSSNSYRGNRGLRGRGRGRGHTSLTRQSTNTERVMETVIKKHEEHQTFRGQSEGPSKIDPFLMNMCIDGQKVEMEIDTGATYSIINEQTYRGLIGSKP